MTPAARVQAALEALADIETRRRPAADALKDWGLAHRFAGSGDRAAIASLVYDALRRRASSSWRLGEDTPRAHLLGALPGCAGSASTRSPRCFPAKATRPTPLTEDERTRLARRCSRTPPTIVRGDYPEWLAPAFAESFGDEAAAAGAALAARAPVDLRVNTLKTNRDKALSALAHLNAAADAAVAGGPAHRGRPDGRGPALSAEPAYVKGQVEVQDEASQLAALLSGAAPGAQVLDLCAGAGGKTLALAAMLAGKGQVYATDEDGRRLAPLYARLERSGARNVQVRSPRGGADPVADLAGRCDLVFVDAPCTGSGAWRRSPDAKWRIRPGALAAAHQGSDEILDRAREIREAGRSAGLRHLFGAEARERGPGRRLPGRPTPISCRSTRRRWRARRGCAALAEFASKLGRGHPARPACTRRTDGFYIAGLVRAGLAQQLERVRRPVAAADAGNAPQHAQRLDGARGFDGAHVLGVPAKLIEQRRRHFSWRPASAPQMNIVGRPPANCGLTICAGADAVERLDETRLRDRRPAAAPSASPSSW